MWSKKRFEHTEVQIQAVPSHNFLTPNETLFLEQVIFLGELAINFIHSIIFYCILISTIY